jgi:hypothetical protein
VSQTFVLSSNDFTPVYAIIVVRGDDRRLRRIVHVDLKAPEWLVIDAVREIVEDLLQGKQ